VAYNTSKVKEFLLITFLLGFVKHLFYCSWDLGIRFVGFVGKKTINLL